MTECRTCHAPIRWARTGSGKAIPLDATPNPAGNVELTLGGIAKTWGTSHTWRGDEVRYMPHHATCSEAAKWRKTS